MPVDRSLDHTKTDAADVRQIVHGLGGPGDGHTELSTLLPVVSSMCGPEPGRVPVWVESAEVTRLLCDAFSGLYFEDPFLGLGQRWFWAVLSVLFQNAPDKPSQSVSKSDRGFVHAHFVFETKCPALVWIRIIFLSVHENGPCSVDQIPAHDLRTAACDRSHHARTARGVFLRHEAKVTCKLLRVREPSSVIRQIDDVFL